MVLTDVKIRNAPIKARRYRMTDSHGLSIEIPPKGKRLGPKEKPRKFWRYRYKLNGRENLFAAGEWCQAPTGETPEEAEARRDAGRLTLAEARLARVEWRDMVRRGQHPRLVRATGRLLAAQSAAMTFRAVAEEFVDKRGGHWEPPTAGTLSGSWKRIVTPPGDLDRGWRRRIYFPSCGRG